MLQFSNSVTTDTATNAFFLIHGVYEGEEREKILELIKLGACDDYIAFLLNNKEAGSFKEMSRKEKINYLEYNAAEYERYHKRMISLRDGAIFLFAFAGFVYTVINIVKAII